MNDEQLDELVAVLRHLAVQLNELVKLLQPPRPPDPPQAREFLPPRSRK